MNQKYLISLKICASQPLGAIQPLSDKIQSLSKQNEKSQEAKHKHFHKFKITIEIEYLKVPTMDLKSFGNVKSQTIRNERTAEIRSNQTRNRVK